LESGAPFDGIVAASDSQGVGAVRVLLNHGRRIPEEIQITGIDDSPMAEACMVPLTSVTSEMEECGRLAMDMLLKRIAGEPVQPVIINPRLVTRQSTVDKA
jgi:LacI family transcriptional regulator